MQARVVVGVAVVLITLGLLFKCSGVPNPPEQHSEPPPTTPRQPSVASAPTTDCTPAPASIAHAQRTPTEDGLKLTMAASSGNTQAVAALLAKGIPIDSTREVGWTAMYVAAVNDHLPMAQFLVNAGADADMPNVDGTRPLGAARNRPMAEFLLAQGADVRAANDLGATALHQAIDNDAMEVAALLLSRGAAVDARQFGCQTALHLAASKERTDLLQLLLDHGVNLNLRDSEGRTALFLAIEKERGESAQLLVKRGADVNVANDGSITPLMRALYTRNEDLAAFLISAGADVKKMTPKGETALHVASSYASLRTVRLLLDHGAEVNPTATEDSGSPLEWAEHRGGPGVAQLLRDRGAATQKYSCTFDGKTYHKGTQRRGACPQGWVAEKIDG